MSSRPKAASYCWLIMSFEGVCLLLTHVILALLCGARHLFRTLAPARRRSPSLAVARRRSCRIFVFRTENGRFGARSGPGPARPGGAEPAALLYIHKLPIVRLWRWLVTQMRLRIVQSFVLSGWEKLLFVMICLQTLGMRRFRPENGRNRARECRQ